MVLQEKMLRGLFGPERQKAMGGWRKLNDEDFNNL
jgi:hypothetical protein